MIEWLGNVQDAIGIYLISGTHVHVDIEEVIEWMSDLTRKDTV